MENVRHAESITHQVRAIRDHEMATSTEVLTAKTEGLYRSRSHTTTILIATRIRIQARRSGQFSKIAAPKPRIIAQALGATAITTLLRGARRQEVQCQAEPQREVLPVQDQVVEEEVEIN